MNKVIQPRAAQQRGPEGGSGVVGGGKITTRDERERAQPLNDVTYAFTVKSNPKRTQRPVGQDRTLHKTPQNAIPKDARVDLPHMGF